MILNTNCNFVHAKNSFHYFTTPGNVRAPQTQGKERAAVADSGPVQGLTEWKYVQDQDARVCGKTAGPAGGDATGNAHRPTPPESKGLKIHC